MTITNNIAAKLAVAFVAVAMAFTLVAPAAKAQDVSGMSLEQLIALVNQLQSQLSGSATVSTGYTFTRSLSQGSTGADVLALQKFLNSSADTQVAVSGAGAPGFETSYYGPATAAAVSKFQVKYSSEILVPSGLTSPTGYFGPASMAKANALNKGGSSNNGGSTTTGPLKGGAGDLTVTNRTANIEKNIAEGATENVVSFEAEADDNSDIAITSIRVAIDVSGTGSLRANRYVDEVLVFLDDEEVGSADISSFSRSGSVHTATINLKNAIVRSGDKERFYVALVARDSISSDDYDDGAFKVSVDRVRYEDATGAILTDSGFSPAVETTGIKFNSAADDNSFSVQNVSGTPAAKILKVNESSTSDEFHVLTFRLKTGSKSADVDVTRIIVDIDSVGTTTATSAINDIWLKVGSKNYRDYTLTATSAIFNIDEGDLVVDGNDTEQVEVYAKFNRTNGNYNSGEKFAFKVHGSEIQAEDVRGNSVGTISGTATGKDMTLATSAATVNSFTWKVAKASSGNSGAITFRFTVDADDEDFSFNQNSLVATTTGTATSSAAAWAVVSGDASLNTGVYTINSGDSATFEVTYSITGPGTKAANVTSVAGQQVPTDKQYSGLEVF